MAGDKSSAKSGGGSAILSTYILLYNLLQTLGWSYLLLQFVVYYLTPQPQVSLYDTIKCTLLVFQNAAVLEILHALFGIVRSNAFVTTQQVFSRVLMVCGVLAATEAGKSSSGLPLAVLAWSLTEIIRYGFYTLNLVDMVPSVLVWLRYTTFIVLYPIGVTGELLCIYAAQREVAEKKLWSYELPNSFNFAFSYQYTLILIMLMYIPFFPQLYLHMFSQRRKVVGGAASKDAAKKA